MNGRGRPLAEIGFAAAMIVVAGAMWWGSRSLPPPSLEPIGPAAFPRATAAILALLSLAVMTGAQRGTAGAAAAGGRPGLAAVMVALTLAYLGVMEGELLGFRAATVVYLLVLGLVLFDFDWRRRLLPTAAIALGIGIGSHYAFTQLFFLDLP